ncbi:condensation domain-containing protein [Nocardia sp. NPDC051321]|uniref:condensation domain-containing protein n=1 Tax=Nocardia sp. NPDC051321 TaxID=3364323 RepID=UPI0037BD51BC
MTEGSIIVRQAPATLGQKSQWYEQRIFPPSYWRYWNISLRWHLDGIDWAIVCAAVDELVRRHEGLRTTFSVDDSGTLVQNVHEARETPIRQWELNEVANPTSFFDEFAQEGFDPMREFPVRFAVLKDRAAVHTLCCVGNHIVFDGWTAGLIERDLRVLLSEAEGGRGRPDRQQHPMQPYDVALSERSAKGMVRTERGMRYWKEQLRQIPASLFPDRGGALDARMADWTQRTLIFSTLKSPALYRALGQLRTPADTSKTAILLAAYVALLARYTGRSSIPLKLMCANRTDPGTHDTAVCLAQPVLVHCHNTGSFRELAANCYSAVLKGFRHGRYDSETVDSMVIEESRARREPVFIERYFDVFWNEPDDEWASRCRDAVIDTATSKLETSETYVDRGPEQSLRIRVDNGRILLTLWADTDCIPEPITRRILLGIEAIVIAACRDDDRADGWLPRQVARFVDPRAAANRID